MFCASAWSEAEGRGPGAEAPGFELSGERAAFVFGSEGMFLIIRENSVERLGVLRGKKVQCMSGRGR